MVLGALGLVIVLAVGAAAGYAWYLNHKVHRINVNGLSDASSSGADQGTQNILMVGSTSRCALTQQNAAYGLCSQGVTGVNSDVVMILHLNPATHTVSILSIPRDLFVPNARKEGANKIDAALVEGPSQLVAAVQEDLGIPINHYVELNFDTFANVVNALGGVKMYFPEPVYDAYSGLNVQTPGCLTLNGFQALQVVRARHLQYKAPGVTSTNPADWPQEAESDLARIRRDHEFLRVLAETVSAKGLGNPITDQQLVSSVVGQLTVDQSFTASDMIKLVLDYHGANIAGTPQLTIPVDVDQFGSYTYQGGSYGDVEFPSEPNDQNVIDQFLGITAATDPMTGTALPAPSTVTVSVLNGTGAYNQAATTAFALGGLGFHIVGTGDADPVGDPAETVVTYANAAAEPAAVAVANSLSGQVIMAMGPTSNGAAVTVVTGTDFSVNALAPPATTTTTAAKGAKKATTTTTTTVAPTTTSTTEATVSNGEFTAPTPSVEALAPWDPRSCTASGGEGP
jgi:LCP family protein required for cell wall assembly